MSAQPDVSPAACAARLAVRNTPAYAAAVAAQSAAGRWVTEYAIAEDAALTDDARVVSRQQFDVAVDLFREACAAVRAIEAGRP